MRANNDHAATLMNQSISRHPPLVYFLPRRRSGGLSRLDRHHEEQLDKVQLEKARDEAEELTKIKQRFPGEHEPRNPDTTPVHIGFAEYIKKQNKVDLEAVQAIHSSSEHLLHIVNEVLDYSRISSGSLTLDNEPFGLLPIVREVESAIRIQAQKESLSFILDTDEMDYTAAGRFIPPSSDLI